jgi:hypothetical protein
VWMICDRDLDVEIANGLSALRGDGRVGSVYFESFEWPDVL